MLIHCFTALCMIVGGAYIIDYIIVGRGMTFAGQEQDFSYEFVDDFGAGRRRRRNRELHKLNHTARAYFCGVLFPAYPATAKADEGPSSETGRRAKK